MQRSNNGSPGFKENKRPTKLRFSPATIFQSALFLILGVYIGIGISGVFRGKDNALPRVRPSSGISSLRRDDIEVQNQAQSLFDKLKDAEEQARRLQAEVESLKLNQSLSLLKVNDLNESCNSDEKRVVTKDISVSSKSGGNLSIDPINTNQHPFCQALFPNPTPSAMAVWRDHAMEIFEASRHPNDSRFYFHDFTAQLLQIISPLLPRSVKTAPFDWRPIENALTIAWRRYEYLKLPKKERDAIPPEERPRPLKMLIMGGSLLVGTNCRMMMREMNFQFKMPKRECTWSYRVGEFLNGLFLGVDTTKKLRTEQLIDVTKVAMGGTNTATGSVIWQYDLIPEEAQHPDIVLNAYSTNDMHILTVLEAQSSNTTLRDRTFEMMQDFVRKVLDSRNCPTTGDNDESIDESSIPPLLLHMDDYLGNEQRKIWETTESSQGTQVLANYYGFVSMSYADVIREFVYGDTFETWFSSEWWVTESKKKNLIFDRQIHPGMGMHIASMWVTAFNLLHLASTYCSIPTGALAHLAKNKIDEYQPGLWGLPELDMKFKQPKGKPQPRPNGLPPELTKDLLLEDVTTLWRQREQSLYTSTSCHSNSTSTSNVSSTRRLVKCPFSWVSGLSLQQNNITWINEYFHGQSRLWSGWDISDDGGKIGFVPSTKSATSVNSTITLEFDFPQKIQTVTFFYMKSYGSKWEKSELQTKIYTISKGSSDLSLLEERNMLGTHNKNTSEMYTEEIMLKQPANIDQKLKVEINLVGGETFKIMGLAICS